MTRTSPLLPFLVLAGALAFPARPAPTAKEAADDWTLGLDNGPGAHNLETVSPEATP